jgi:energy-coupling factor transporter ATP-binding protein EcfA2
MIEIRGLTKRYGPQLALDRLSFAVPPGAVTGFLGPNGSGKSTTMRILLGLDAADAGTATIGGRHYRELAAKAAVLAAVTLAGCEAVTFAAFLAGRAAMGTGAPGLTDAGVLRALLLSGAYLVLMGLFGLGLGAAVRRSGAAVAWYAGLAILAPMLLGAVSVRAAGYGPIIILANSVSAASVQPQFLSPWAGFAMMALYAAAALAAGALTLARRDA